MNAFSLRMALQVQSRIRTNQEHTKSLAPRAQASPQISSYQLPIMLLANCSSDGDRDDSESIA